MRCYHLAAVTTALLMAGCGTQRSALAAAEGNAPTAAAPLDSSPVARLQQAESEPAAPPVQLTVFEASTEPFPTLAGGKVAVKIRAQVNGFPILDEEILQAVYPYLMRAANLKEKTDVYQRGLQEVIDREVILQDLNAKLTAIKPQYMDKLKEAAHKEYEKQLHTIEANLRKKGLEVQTEEDVKKFFATQGQSLDFYRRQTERQFMAIEYMRSRVFPRVERYVTHEHIVEYYQQHANEFQVQDGVKWQHLFIDAAQYQSREQARLTAEQLAERLRQGEDIANLLSFDNGDSQLRHGEGLGQHRGEIKPVELEPYLFQMKDGNVGPVVEGTNGFNVFRLVKREVAGLRPLDEKAQAEIKRKIQNQVFEREYQRLLAELKHRATIDISRD